MKFEAGKTYYTRSICDHDTVIKITIASRTEKSIKTTEGKTLRIREHNGIETVKPWGSYSMAPTVAADREWKEEPKPAPVAKPEPVALPSKVVNIADYRKK